MNTLRTAGLGLAIVASLLLVSGTLGFTSTTADRDVSVAVVEDDKAFVGYEVEKDHRRLNASEDDEVELVEIENRLGQEVNVTDVVLDSHGGVEFGEVEKPQIDPGHEAELTADLEQCTSDSETEVSVTVTVEGDSVEATLFGDSDSETVGRSFTVTCEKDDDG